MPSSAAQSVRSSVVQLEQPLARSLPDESTRVRQYAVT